MADQKKEQMISADALKNQIAKVKKCFRSENSDYMTGYISALSSVEGMIAYLSDDESAIKIPETPTYPSGVYMDKEESGLLED